MAHGIQIFNSRGGVQFDSEENLETYIVTESGSASTLTYTDDGSKLLFCKGSDPDYVYYASYPNSSTINFNAWDDINDTEVGSVSMDYFIAERANTVTIPGTETHGVQIKNPDGSVQFDSRALLLNKNFTVDTILVNSKWPILLTESINSYVSYFGGWSKKGFFAVRFNPPKYIGCQWINGQTQFRVTGSGTRKNGQNLGNPLTPLYAATLLE
jgi:hypothetical protein